MQDKLSPIRLLFALSCSVGLSLLSSHPAAAQTQEAEQQGTSPAASTSPASSPGKDAKSPNSPVRPAARSSAAWIFGSPDTGGTEGLQDEAQTSQENSKADQYVSLLDTGQLIRFTDLAHYRFLYGIGLSNGYYETFGSGQSQNGGGLVTIFSPYLSLAGSTAKTSYALQYSPTISRLGGSGGTQVYHNSSFVLASEFTRRWGFDFSLTNAYGEDGLRLLAQPSFRAISGIPVTNPNSFQLEQGLQNVLLTDASFSLHWRATSRRQITLTTSEIYRDTPDTGGHANVAGFQLNLEQVLSRSATLLAYGEFHRFSPISCDSSGGGLGLSLNPMRSRRTTFRFSVGPGFGFGGCPKEQGLNIEGSLVMRPSATSDFHVTFDRRFKTLFVTPQLQSRESLSAGFDKSWRWSLQFRLDTGVYRVGQCCGLAPSPGYFAFVQVSRPLVHSTTLLANYRFFYRQVHPVDLGRNQVILTLQWRSEPKELNK